MSKTESNTVVTYIEVFKRYIKFAFSSQAVFPTAAQPI